MTATKIETNQRIRTTGEGELRVSHKGYPIEVHLTEVHLIEVHLIEVGGHTIAHALGVSRKSPPQLNTRVRFRFNVFHKRSLLRNQDKRAPQDAA